MQWSKGRGPLNKQLSTKHTHKNKDRVTRTPIQAWGKLICSGRVSSSCATSGTRRVNQVNRTGCRDITEVLLKVALNTINLSLKLKRPGKKPDINIEQKLYKGHDFKGGSC